MHSVACGAVDDRGVGYILPIMNHNGPDVDEAKETDVGEFLQRKDEGKKMVWHRLGETV